MNTDVGKIVRRVPTFWLTLLAKYNTNRYFDPWVSFFYDNDGLLRITRTRLPTQGSKFAKWDRRKGLEKGEIKAVNKKAGWGWI